jgi:hypothetical protein
MPDFYKIVVVTLLYISSQSDDPGLSPFGIYRGEKTTKERNAFRRVLLEFRNRPSAVRPVATAKTASDLFTLNRGS